MATIFITHSHTNNSFATKITKRLEEFGYTVWVDLKNIKPGKSIPGEISKAFNLIDYQLIIISEASNRSKWVQKELEIGINFEITRTKPHLIGIRIDNAPVPTLISEKQYVNFQDFEKGWQNLSKELPDISFNEFKKVNLIISEFLDYCKYERNVLSNTLKVYNYNLSKLGDYFKAKGLGDPNNEDFDWKIVKEKHMKGYKNYLETNSNLAPSSIHLRLSTYRNFFAFMKKENIISSTPMENIILPKRSESEKVLSDVDDLNLLLNSIPDIKIEYRVVLELMFSTGAKISELSSLMMTDLDLTHNKIQLRQVRANNSRQTLLNERSRYFLERYLKYKWPLLKKMLNKEYLFLSPRGDKIKERSFQHILTKLCADLEINNIGLGDIARIQAVYLLENKVQINAISKLSGLSHVSIGKLAPLIDEDEISGIHTKAYINFDNSVIIEPSINQSSLTDFE